MAAHDPLVGRVLADRYRIEERIGEGGMGTVYRAHQASVGRDVAVKILRPEIAMDPSVRARFAREARSASRVASVRVSAVFDFGETEEGLLFLAMELLQGETLAGRLAREGALPPQEAVRIAAEIARALEVAHEAGVIHRDLKPENVFLERRDKLVKVLDFGIAKMLAGDEEGVGDPGVTAAGALVGTPLYMSPEAAARRGRVGPAGDLYALGVILFEMLAGRPPFEEAEPVLLLGMHLRVPAPRLAEVAPGLGVSDALEGLVAQLLSKKAEQRPGSAREVAERLEALRETASVGAVTPVARVPSPVPAPPSRSRHRGLFVVAGLAALGLVGVGAAVGLGAFDASESPRIAPRADSPPVIASADPPPAESPPAPDPLAPALAASGAGSPLEAIALYREAFTRDPGVRDDPRMRRDVLRMASSDEPGVREAALGAIDEWYGSDLLPLVEELLRAEREQADGARRERLEAVRERLREDTPTRRSARRRSVPAAPVPREVERAPPPPPSGQRPIPVD